MNMLTYQKRNLDNIAKLADHTKAAALQWHKFLEDHKIDLLIYETIRSKETQAANVRKGASQTMKSYHIVGQALDFVPVVHGETDWGGYNRPDILKAVKEAKRLGFTWGQDWITFKDSPHLQFAYKGYGTDTFGKWKPEVKKQAKYPNPNVVFKEGDKAKYVGYIQKELGVKADNIFGPKTESALKAWQKKHGLKADGLFGAKSWKVMFGE
jgi:peptidoglycan L-alanyl-D-glutamate endopeptidase CwlK